MFLLNYANSKIRDVKATILIIILIEFTAAGTGEELPNFEENTGATADTGANKHKTIIFLTTISKGSRK